MDFGGAAMGGAGDAGFDFMSWCVLANFPAHKKWCGGNIIFSYCFASDGVLSQLVRAIWIWGDGMRRRWSYDLAKRQRLHNIRYFTQWNSLSSGCLFPQVPWDTRHISPLFYWCLPNNSWMRLRYYQSIFTLFQLRFNLPSSKFFGPLSFFVFKDELTELPMMQGQIWRLITTYLFFGMFSIDFLFHMYFLVRYCRSLEEGDFRGRTAHFVMMIIFGVTFMTLVAPFVSVHFLGSSLSFMMVYVWGRRNEDMRMSFLGVFTFNAPYLPWVMLAFSMLLGHSVTIDAIGILVGHTYYFLEYVYPVVAEIRGWKCKKILEPPRILHWLCGTYQEPLHLHQD